MFLAALMVVTTVPQNHTNAADAEAAGLVLGHLAFQMATPGIAAARLARVWSPCKRLPGIGML